jgi:hypothetical protein
MNASREDDYDQLYNDNIKYNPFPESNVNLYGNIRDLCNNSVDKEYNKGLRYIAEYLASHLVGYSLLESAPKYDYCGKTFKVSKFNSKLDQTNDVFKAWANILISAIHAYDNIVIESISENDLILLHIGLKKANSEVKKSIKLVKNPNVNGLKPKDAKKIIRAFDDNKKYIYDFILFIDSIVLCKFYDKISTLNIWKSFIDNPISTRFGYWDIIFKGVSLNDYQTMILDIFSNQGRKVIFDPNVFSKGKTSLYSCFAALHETTFNKSNNITVLFTAPSHVCETAMCIARTAQLHIALLEKYVHVVDSKIDDKISDKKLIVDTNIITNIHPHKSKEPDTKELCSDSDRFDTLNRINRIHLLVGTHEVMNIFLNNYPTYPTRSNTKFILVIDEYVSEIDFNLINTALHHPKVNTLVLASGTSPSLDKMPSIKKLIEDASKVLPRKLICLKPTKIPDIGVINTIPDITKEGKAIRVVTPFRHLPENISDLNEYLLRKHFRYEIQRGMTLYTVANLVNILKYTVDNYDNLWKDIFNDLNPDIFFRIHGFSDSSSIKWMNSLLVHLDSHKETHSDTCNKFYELLKFISILDSDDDLTSINFIKLVKRNNLVLSLTQNDPWTFISNTLQCKIDIDDFNRTISKYHKEYDRYLRSVKIYEKRQDSKESKKSKSKKNDQDYDDDDFLPVEPKYSYPYLNNFSLNSQNSIIDIDINNIVRLLTSDKIIPLLTGRGALSDSEYDRVILDNLHKLSVLSFTSRTSSGLNTTAKEIFISDTLSKLDILSSLTINEVIDSDYRQAFGRVGRKEHNGICKIHYENADAINTILYNDYDTLTAKGLEREFYIYSLKTEITKSTDPLKRELTDKLKDFIDNKGVLPYVVIENNFTSDIELARNLYRDDIVDETVLTDMDMDSMEEDTVVEDAIAEETSVKLKEVSPSLVKPKAASTKTLLKAGIYIDQDGKERCVNSTRIPIPAGWTYLRPNNKTK